MKYPNIGPRLSIVTSKGELVARLADNGTGTGRSQFIAPHGLAVDSHGDIYVGEVSFTAWPRVGEGPPPKTLRSLRKLVRLAA
jgi:hypothetical protein